MLVFEGLDTVFLHEFRSTEVLRNSSENNHVEERYTRIYLIYFFGRCSVWSNWLVTEKNERIFIRIKSISNNFDLSMEQKFSKHTSK